MKITNEQINGLYRVLGMMEGASFFENDTAMCKISEAMNELVREVERREAKPTFARIFGQPHVCMCDRCRAVIEWTAAYNHVCKEE